MQIQISDDICEQIAEIERNEKRKERLNKEIQDLEDKLNLLRKERNDIVVYPYHSNILLSVAEQIAAQCDKGNVRG